MNAKIKFLLALFLLGSMAGCKSGNGSKKARKNESRAMSENDYKKGTFAYDLNFVSKHQKIVVLKDASGKGKIMICPELQGRVLTSTAAGIEGKSFGYLNYERIGSRKETPHIQSYGGEDRFWIGPQGGQYAIFFKKGDPFDLDHWETPAPLDKEAFELISHTDTSAVFAKKMHLKNFSGTEFDVEVRRDIALIDKATASNYLGVNLNDVDFVGFESRNELINSGKEAWQKSKGLLSIWILGMYPGNPSTTVAIPYKAAGKNEQVVAEYFTDIVGKLPADRLAKTDKMVYYKGDGNYCSKIGLTPKHALPAFGSYNAADNVLTIIQYTLPEGENDYVNSSFEFQKEPYKGDAVNSYNDGTLDHSPAPPTFYELESSSPARELKPGQSIRHSHRTFHFTGDRAKLNAIAKTILGTGIDEIETQFK
jgi:hypothetical protein